jgi:Family of unknown function (DUF5343)
MTVSQFEADQTREIEQGPVFDDGPKKSSTLSTRVQSRRNPPARNTSRFWFERFLAVIQRQNPSIIDVSFLSQIAPSNEGKLLAQLKFLGVIDEQGKSTKILPMLNMVGEEQKKAFQQIARDAYRELEYEVKMDKAVTDDVVNFFIRKYSFTRDKAVNAAKFYLYLAEKGGVPVSGELASFLTEKISGPTQSSNSPSSVGSSTRLAEKIPARVGGRDSRPSNAINGGRQQRRIRAYDVDEERASIQTVINIKLEKDTPKEYWDRVLALLGERQMSEVSVQSAELKSTRMDVIDQELSGDSAFT